MPKKGKSNLSRSSAQARAARKRRIAKYSETESVLASQGEYASQSLAMESCAQRSQSLVEQNLGTLQETGRHETNKYRQRLKETNCIPVMPPLNTICRTCDASNPVNMLKLNFCPNKYGGKTLLDMLKEVTKIEFDMEYIEKFQQFMCRTCFRKLKNAYDFIIQVRETNKQMTHFLNGIVKACLKGVPKDVSTVSITDVKKEKESDEDSITQNEFLTDDEYDCNETLSPLVVNEPIGNCNDESVDSDEYDLELSNYKIMQSTISKNEITHSRTEYSKQIPVEICSEQTNELILKDEPCEIESERTLENIAPSGSATYIEGMAYDNHRQFFDQVGLHQEDMTLISKIPSPSTTQQVTNLNKRSKTTKTPAEYARDYRKQIKILREILYPKKPPKTPTERSRAFRERKRALKNATNQQLTNNSPVDQIVVHEEVSHEPIHSLNVEQSGI